MTVTKKLKLSEFLAGYEDTPAKAVYTPKEKLTVSFSEFCNTISSFSGSFSINEKTFSNVLPSSNNLYFFNEDGDCDYMIIFDPIIDIKQRDNSFMVFYYPDQVISIILKEANVKENQITENTKGKPI